MTRRYLLSLVTGECVFEMRNCLLGDVSQSAEREIRAESDAASAGETTRVDCSSRFGGSAGGREGRGEGEMLCNYGG